MNLHKKNDRLKTLERPEEFMQVSDFKSLRRYLRKFHELSSPCDHGYPL